MKRKYHGLITVAIFILMLSGAGGYYKSGVWQKRSVITGEMRPLTSAGWVPSAEQVQHMEQLLPKMRQLAVPSARENQPSPLYIFGQRAPRSGARGTYAQAEAAQPSYRLSLTLLAGPLRYCIVNGAFVSEGGQLANGAAVKKIDNQRVLIANERQVEWIYLQDPTQPTHQAEPMLFTPRKDKS